MFVSLCVCICRCIYMLVIVPQIKADVAYARSKGIEVGGYDLIVWTRHNIPDYWRAVGGDGTCIASSWCVAIVNVFLQLMDIVVILVYSCNIMLMMC